MKITIKTMKNKRYTLDVSEEDTIGQLKQRIDAEFKLGEASTQKLIHSGKVLKDDQTIGGCKIQESDFLVVMVTPSKPAKKEDAPPVASPPAQTAPAPAPVSAPPQQQQPAPSQPSSAPPSSSSAPSSAPPAALGQQAASNLVMGPQYEEMVANLMALGFPNDQVVAALRASFNNPDRAAQYLFSGIPPELLAQQQQAPPQGGAAAPAQGAGAEQGDVADPEDAEMDPEDEAALAQGLQNSPEFAQLRQLMQQNPQVIPMILNQIGQQNPELLQALSANPQALLQILNNPEALLGAAGGAGVGAGAGAPPMGGRGGAHVVQITPEEKASLDRLEALGFGRRRALEAFLICDRNEELAANYLFDHMNDPEDAPQQGQGQGRPPSGQ